MLGCEHPETNNNCAIRNMYAIRSFSASAKVSIKVVLLKVTHINSQVNASSEYIYIHMVNQILDISYMGEREEECVTWLNIQIQYR